MRKRRSSNVYLYNSSESVLHIKEVKQTLLRWLTGKLTTFFALFLHLLFILGKFAAYLIYRFNELSHYLTSSKKRKKILKEWIESRVENCKINDFKEDFRSGITLCALMESIVAGSCPRFDLLNYDNAKSNIELFLHLLRKHLNIIAEIDAQQILDGSCEDQLISLLSRMKLSSSKFVLKPILKRTQHLDSNRKKTSFELNIDDKRKCFAKGMGLMLAVKGKKARFNIFHEPGVELDLIVEIEGSKISFSRERITNKRSNREIILPTLSEDIRFRRHSRHETVIIPVYYDILVDRIAVTYIPVEVGKHRLSIVCLGQHIMGSPFSVVVDDSIDFQSFPADINAVGPLAHIPRNSTVIRKRIVRQTMLVNGVETPINGRRQSIASKSTRETEAKHTFPRQLSANELLKEYDVISTEDTITEMPSDAPEAEKCEVNSTMTVTGNGDTSHIEKETVKSGNKFCNCDALENVKSSEFETVESPLNCSQSSTESLSRKKRCKIDIRQSSLDDLLCGDDPLSETIELKFQELVKSTISQSDDMPSYVSFDECVCDTNKPIILDAVTKQRLKRQTTYEVVSPAIEHRSTPDGKIKATDKLFDSVKSRRKIFEAKIENDLNSTSSSQSHILKKEISAGFNVKERKLFWESLNQNKSESVTAEVNKTEKKLIHESSTTIKASTSQSDSGISAENNEVKPISDSDNQKSTSKHKYRSASVPCLNRFNNRDKRSNCTISQTKDWYSMQFNGRSGSSSTAGFIDDEIPYFASLLEETAVTSEFTKSRESMDICSQKQSMSLDFNIDPKDKGIYPENILVSGAGINSGKVGVKNRFTVSTKYAGRSFLSVGIQGMEEDDLSYVTMTYIGDSDYEVVYEVTRAGYFIIFVRYGDWNVADSPFICKVTF